MILQTVCLPLAFAIVLATMLCILLLTARVKKSKTRIKVLHGPVMERGRGNGELVTGSRKTAVTPRPNHPVMETGRGIGEMVLLSLET